MGDLKIKPNRILVPIEALREMARNGSVRWHEIEIGDDSICVVRGGWPWADGWQERRAATLKWATKNGVPLGGR